MFHRREPPDFPLDIAREVFEHAARDVPAPSKMKLALVSHAVQAWTDPYIFSHITIHTKSQATLFVNMFCQDLEPSPRLLRILSQVQTFTSTITIPNISWIQILEKFPNLHSIHMATIPPHSHLQREGSSSSSKNLYPALRAVTGSGFGTPFFTGSWPHLSHITHLSLPTTESSNWDKVLFKEWQLPKLKNLTHLACSLGPVYGLGAAGDRITKLKDMLPSGLEVCLVDVKFLRLEDALWLAEFAERVDERFVLCSEGVDAEVTDTRIAKVKVSGIQGLLDEHWTTAQKVILRRQSKSKRMILGR
ncbi:hypothetical protein DL96DRAFT_1716690 [Flagelloscypha sp. PMI_526]|nr:hypothetical protein DL96DRAFT_1716690 [Flagelloscypha sp. PMI_526]